LITRIALVVPKVKDVSPQSIPYGLASIAGYVMEHCKNIKVKFLDEPLGDDIHLELSKFKPHIVGVTANTVQIYDAHKILKYSKKAFGSLTIIGGIHVSTIPEESLPYADIVVMNDGEIVFKEIVDNFQKGVIQKGIIRGIELENLDLITIPYHLLGINKYLQNASWIPILKNLFLMVTSRGCPYKCLFCYNSSRKNKVRYQSAEKIVKDVLFINANYGVTNFYFSDDNFLLNVKRFKTLVELFKKSGVSRWIQWGCQTRSQNLTFEVLELGKSVGLKFVSLGIERGDARLLSILKDSTTIGDHEKVFNFCKTLDIKVGGGTIWGYFDETKEDMENSFKWLIGQTNLSFVASGCIILYPNAKISEIYRKKGYLPDKIDYTKLLQTSIVDETYVFLENMNKKEFGKRLVDYGRLLRLYTEVNLNHSFTHFLQMMKYARWWWGWSRHPMHMIKLIYRIWEIKVERTKLLKNQNNGRKKMKNPQKPFVRGSNDENSLIEKSITPVI